MHRGLVCDVCAVSIGVGFWGGGLTSMHLTVATEETLKTL